MSLQRLREQLLRSWRPLLFLVVGGGVALLSVVSARSWQSQLEETTAIERAGKLDDEVRARLTEKLTALRAVAGLFAVNPAIAREDLAHFLRVTDAGRAARGSPLAWAPRVPVPGSPDEARFPVAFVEAGSFPAPAGIVAGSDLPDLVADTRVLDRSCETGEVAAIPLVAPGNRMHDALLAAPVYRAETAGDARAPCDRVRGFVVGMVSFEAELRHALWHLPQEGVTAVELTDVATGARTSRVATGGVAQGAGAAELADQPFAHAEEILFADRRLRIEAAMGRSSIAASAERVSLLIGAGSLLFVLVTFAAILAWRDRMHRREWQVENRATERLRRSEERWRAALEVAGEAIWDWDLRSDSAYYSPWYVAMLGYAEGDLAPSGAQFRALLHPDDAARVTAELEGFCAAGPQTHQILELRLRCKDGSHRWILWRGMVVERGDDGAAIRLIGVNSDIHMKKIAVDAMRDHEAELDAIIKASPDGIVTIGQDRRIRSATPAFLGATGFEASEVLGLSEQDFESLLATRSNPSAEHRRCERCRMRATGAAPSGAGGGATSPLVCGSCRFEFARPTRRVLRRVRAELQTTNVVAIEYFQDITVQAEIDRMKSEFIATAAHELRTPLTSIYGYSELLSTADFNVEHVREFAGTIHAQAETLVGLVNELLDLSRIEARGGRAFDFSDRPLIEIVRGAVDELLVANDPRKIDADYGTRSIWVSADKDRLKQAVTNVLSNAYKYSFGKGRIALDIVTRQGETREEVGVRVVDEGVGMDEEQLTHVFERFWRADRSGRVPGTGLGMSLVKETLAHHRGAVEIRSTPGAGTEVVLWLPVIPKPLSAMRVVAG
jgi:PAS domain S-box-containing protein